MNSYFVPRDSMTQAQYYRYVSGLPWVFTGAASLTVSPNEQTVTLDGTITGFTQLPPPAPAPKPPISKLAFLALFTDTELATILTVAQSNMTVAVYVKKLDAATEVLLTDQLTIDSMNALESAGILAAGRAAQILGG